jgi:hypothetical protein
MGLTNRPQIVRAFAGPVRMMNAILALTIQLKQLLRDDPLSRVIARKTPRRGRVTEQSLSTCSRRHPQGLYWFPSQPFFARCADGL